MTLPQTRVWPEQQLRSGLACRQRTTAHRKHGITAGGEPVRCIAGRYGVGRLAAARPCAATS